MKIKDLDIEIISVNYRTPDLTERMIKSIRQFNQDIPLRIIDGSGLEWSENNCHLRSIMKEFKFNMTVFNHNIHHGPGMDWGIKSSENEWVLTIDSDQFIMKDVFEYEIPENKFFIGQKCIVNKDGFGNEGQEINDEYNILYPHPRLCLIKVSEYKKYTPFILHGAPCISTWTEVNLKDVDSIHMIDFISEGYINNEGKGTLERWGWGVNGWQPVPKFDK